MPFPISSRSTQITAQNRFPVIEFESLLDSVEAAALLRMHPNTLKKKARLSLFKTTGSARSREIMGCVKYSRSKHLRCR
jgi:hypothetical protein